MNNTDLLAIRSYVTCKDEHNYDNVGKDIVIVQSITHSNLQQQHIEIRLYKSDTIDILRNKIYRQTGTQPIYQHIQIYNDTIRTNLICEIAPTVCGESYKIGYFFTHHNMSIHVIDLNPNSISANASLEDVSLVPKFTLSQDEYQQRKNTLYAWKQQQKQNNPTFTLQQYEQQYHALQHAKMCYKRNVPLPQGFIYDENTKEVIPDLDNTKVIPSKNNKEQKDGESNASLSSSSLYGIETVQHCIIGQRCQIRIGQRRGMIRWVGMFTHNTHDDGYWVGIELDEPTGKNNGTLCNTTYFIVAPKYGAFVRGTQVDVGEQYSIRTDFDTDDEDDDSDEEI